MISRFGPRTTRTPHRSRDSMAISEFPDNSGAVSGMNASGSRVGVDRKIDVEMAILDAGQFRRQPVGDDECPIHARVVDDRDVPFIGTH